MNENLINENMYKEQKRIIKLAAKITAINSRSSSEFFSLTTVQKENIINSSIIHRDVLLASVRLQFNNNIYYNGKYLKYLIKIINENIDGEKIQKINNTTNKSI